MDIKKAASVTSKYITISKGLPDSHPEYGKDHLLDMAKKIVTGEVDGEKAHRWLGWIQGCVCVGGGATLQTMKEVNHAA